jgi:hypothetical protein
VIGLLAALEAWFARDRDAEHRRWTRDLETIAAAVGAVPGCTARLLPPEPGDEQPQLELGWARDRVGLDGMELRRRLLAGTPRIMLDDMSAGADRLVIEPFSLQPGEAEIVGAALARALGSAPVVPPAPEPAPAAVAGAWQLDVALTPAPRRHVLQLRQEGPALAGTQRAEAFAGEVSGRVAGDAVTLVIEALYEGAIMTFRFAGTVAGEAMAGTVLLGSTTPGTRGEVSYSQYGSATWTARRL